MWPATGPVPRSPRSARCRDLPTAAKSPVPAAPLFPGTGGAGSGGGSPLISRMGGVEPLGSADSAANLFHTRSRERRPLFFPREEPGAALFFLRTEEWSGGGEGFSRAAHVDGATGN